MAMYYHSGKMETFATHLEVGQFESSDEGVVGDDRLDRAKEVALVAVLEWGRHEPVSSVGWHGGRRVLGGLYLQVNV